MRHRDQFDLFEASFGMQWNLNVIPSKPDFAWKFSSRDLETITISPSIDASDSKHWHGHIINGYVV